MQVDTDTATLTKPPVDPGFLAAQTTKKNPFADLAALKLSDTMLSSAKETPVQASGSEVHKAGILPLPPGRRHVVDHRHL
jgi:hypothetical protein